MFSLEFANTAMLKVRFLLFSLFVLFNSFTSNAQFDVEISGTFPGANGKTIRLFEYDDMITYRKDMIDTYEISEKEFFEFKLEIFEPQYVFFRIDHANIGFFIEPDKSYTLEFDSVNFNELNDRRNPYLEPYHFSFKIANAADDELNILIDSLENVFDKFIAENFSKIRRVRFNDLMHNFRKSTDSLFSNIDNQYFKNYYDYKFAKYYRLTNVMTEEDLARDYFIERKVLYNNVEYMDFFTNYFNNFIFRSSSNVRLEDVEFTVNELGNYSALMDSLGRDTILRNEVLREMVLLISLKNIYSNPDFVQENIDAVMNQLIEQSRFEKHRKIAQNILWSNKYLSQGSNAPDFKIESHRGNIYSLSDFEGKFLYLNFFTSWCIPCMAEFPVLEDIHEKYGDFIEIVSISVDRHETDYIKFLKSYDYPWKFAHFKGNFEILDDYLVRSYPVFVLISPDSKIINTNLNPSIAIQGYFDRLKSIHTKENGQGKNQLYYDLE